MSDAILFVRGGLPQKPYPVSIEIDETAGAIVTNAGPNRVYFRDRLPVDQNTSDGSLGVGETQTLYGTAHFVVDEGAAASSLDNATVLVAYNALVSQGSDLALQEHIVDPDAHSIPTFLEQKLDVPSYTVRTTLGSAETVSMSSTTGVVVLRGVLSANLTVTLSPSPLVAGQRFRLELKQDTSARTVTITDGVSTPLSISNIPSGSGAVFTIEGEVLASDIVRTRLTTTVQEWTPTPPDPGDTSLLWGTSFIRTALPATPTIDTTFDDTLGGYTADLIPPYLSNEADVYGSLINITDFAPDPYTVPDSTTRTPVCLVDKQGAVTQQSVLKARILAQTGVPIPAEYLARTTFSQDAPATILCTDFTHVNPSNGQTMTGMLWDLAGLKPAGSRWDQVLAQGGTHDPSEVDPRTQGFTWECRNAMRHTDLTRNPGHGVDRFLTATSANQSQFLVAEDNTWGATATCLPMWPLMIMRADMEAWAAQGPWPWEAGGVAYADRTPPAHALGIATRRHPFSPPRNYRWPAQNHDASAGNDNTSPVIEGTRLWMPRTVGFPTAGSYRDATGTLRFHPLAAMIMRQAQEYGFVVWDTSGNSPTFRTEKTVKDFFYGVPSVDKAVNRGILEAFPWTSMKVLAVGSDLTPNP